MNHAYYNANGTVVVSDENGNMRQVENWPDIEEILVQENVIEEGERILLELLEQKTLFYDNDNDNNTIFSHIPYVSMSLLLFIVPYGTVTFMGHSFKFPDYLTTEIATYSALFFTVPLATILLYADILNYRWNKKRFRRKDRNECEIVFLESYLEEKRKTIAALKSKSIDPKSVAETDSIEAVSTLVDDNEALEKLKKLLDFSYDLGYNLDMYYQSYQDGTIKEKLQDDEYSDTKIRFAEKYLKEKGPVLVKKRKQ